ncbi:MAG: IS6 family transposase [Robiginitomaculum sp.]|nr:IS6 family transposase [Robiginitomaculum sp.]
MITDRLRSYKVAMRQLGNQNKQDTTKHNNHQAENSHQPFRRRERTMNKFKAEKSRQKFVSIHAQFHNHFNHERHFNRREHFKKYRDSARAEW